MSSLSSSRGVRCMTVPPGLLLARAPGARWIAPRSPGSESRQALRAVVGDGRAGDLLQRTVRLNGVTDQLRAIPVDLVEIGVVGRQPAIARTAGNDSIESPEGAISGNLRARGILQDGEDVAVDAPAADVAVTEDRAERQPVIRGDGQPAQFSGLAWARVERRDRADVEVAVLVDAAQSTPVADGVGEDEAIGPVTQELHVPRGAATAVLELGLAERAVGAHR